MFLLIDNHIQIPMSDGLLDRVADLLENPETRGGGFWIAGHLDVERDGEPGYPSPDRGHQRMWVAPGQLVTLVYDRALSEDPDWLPDAPHTIVL